MAHRGSWKTKRIGAGFYKLPCFWDLDPPISTYEYPRNNDKNHKIMDEYGPLWNKTQCQTPFFMATNLGSKSGQTDH